MRKKTAHVWLSLDDLFEELLVMRFGRGWSSRHGVTLIKNPNGRGYFDPRAALHDEIRHALESGRITAHGQLRRPRPGELGFVEIHPAEWATLNFSDFGGQTRFASFSVRSVDAEKLWPRGPAKVTSVPTMPKSIFQTDPALEIFQQNKGWPHYSQGAA